MNWASFTPLVQTRGAGQPSYFVGSQGNNIVGGRPYDGLGLPMEQITDSITWHHYLDVAEKAFQVARYQDAERLYQKALSEAEIAAEDTSVERADLFGRLGDLYKVQGWYPEAEATYTKMRACQETQGKESLDAARALNKLGMVYRAQGKFGEVEQYFRRALTIFEQHADTADKLMVAETFESLADFYRAHGKYAWWSRSSRRSPCAKPSSVPIIKASVPTSRILRSSTMPRVNTQKRCRLYARALKHAEGQWGLDHASVAIVLNYQAELYRMMGDFPRSEQIHWRALKIRQEQLGIEHPSSAQSLANLALLFHIQNKYNQAEPLYQTLLELRTKDWGPNHMHVAEILNSLAEVYRDQGKFAEAEPLYWRALEITQENLGPEHHSVARALRMLAELYEEQENFEEADRLYRWGLGLSEKSLGAEHPDVAELVSRYAALQKRMHCDEHPEGECEHLDIPIRTTKTDIGSNLSARCNSSAQLQVFACAFIRDRIVVASFTFLVAVTPVPYLKTAYDFSS